MIRRALALMLACSALSPRPSASQTRPTRRSPCTVSRVIDGDTITCSGGRRVRLLRIDAPESRQHPAGDSAKATLLRLVHKDVPVTLELGRDSLDRYGRTLAFVWRDSLLVNEEMVRRGWALVYKYNKKDPQYDARLDAVQDAAQRARRGWWDRGGISCTPGDFRRHRCT